MKNTIIKKFSEHPILTVCIATRNRSMDFIKCLESLKILGNFPFEILIIDDASDKSVVELLKKFDPVFTRKIKVIRNKKREGHIIARNKMASLVHTPYILSLDDDARLLDKDSIYKALELVKNDPSVGAVAFSQTMEDGSLFPNFMQPGPIMYDCYVPSFIGYGHILRVDVFLKLGGYREIFDFMGEEPEYCKRMLELGFNVVYMPNAKVIHAFSKIGRNELVKIRNGFRNSIFDFIYNAPFPLLFIIPFRFVKYLIKYYKSTESYYELNDKGGFFWIIKEVIINFSSVWSKRKPLGLTTYYRWHKIRKIWPRYPQDNYLLKK